MVFGGHISFVVHDVFNPSNCPKNATATRKTLGSLMSWQRCRCEVIEWDPNDPDDPNRPPDDQSDGAGALATGLLVMLPALAALAL